jgi:hypothetical protein
MADQNPEFFDRPITAKLDLAVKLKAMPLSGFLQILGRTDKELAHIRGSNGSTSALHYVARRLSRLQPDDSAFEELSYFGVRLLRNGADPCSTPIDVAVQDNCSLTPLLVFLKADHWLPRK